MGPGGVAKPGTPPLKVPVGLFLALIGTPAVVSSVGTLAMPESPLLLGALGLSLVYTILAALGLCYYLQARAGKMQPGVYFPAISQLGIERPEQLLYQVGMSLVSACMVVAMLRLDDAILPHFLAGQNATATAATAATFAGCRKAGLIAAAGVCTQGLFTLELKLSPQSFLHWGGTAVFAWGAFQHCEAMLRLLDQMVASPLVAVPAVQLSRAAKHAMLEKVPSMLFFLPILGQVLSAAGIGGAPQAAAAEDAAAQHKKDDDAAGKADARPLTERLAALPEKSQQRMRAYEATLSKWKVSKLDKFDEDPAEREKLRRKLIIEKDMKTDAGGGSAAADSDRGSTRRESTTALADVRAAYAQFLDGVIVRKWNTALAVLEKEARVQAKDTEQAPMSPMVANSMGLMQWIMIGMFVVFFGTYSVDLYYAKLLAAAA